MACSTRSRVCGATLGWPLTTRDTVWCETPGQGCDVRHHQRTGAAVGLHRLLLVALAGRRACVRGGRLGGQREAPARRLL